ncbi:hypothetical protein OO015_00590 [Thermomicrobium sp. 4228-Ro]|uniref:hypothetical protein n=1 Tax=Thermomicrobium sp. 4228-Ro TaxID=2993937 RepID=UPI00224955CC|nr:hypothetical protein [Thermomicrobium sp. 4228-Ro]MCX2726005.1 hypothetical protein [Thermomicrobium sp. 4228-Ro]
MPTTMAPITARETGNWLRWLAEQMGAGAVSLAGRVHQGASAALQGLNVGLSYPGAWLTSFLTGEPAEVPEFRPYDPWSDPTFVAAQRTMGRLPAVQTAPSPPRASPTEPFAAQPVPDQVLTGQAASLADLQQRGIRPTYAKQSEPPPTRRVPTGVQGSQALLYQERIPVTPVPDQIVAGMAPTIADLRKMGLEPTYFFAPAEVVANADRPLIGSSPPNVGKATEALAAGQPIPDQVLLGYYPSLEAMQAVGAQPTYALWKLYQDRGSAGTATTPSTAATRPLPSWFDVYRRQQDVLDVLGVTTERGQALRLAARRAAETPGASVAELYWEQGIEPLLRRYGVSAEEMQRKRKELQELEREWRSYGQLQDFAEFLWDVGYDPLA